jgi:hypothetical protein
MQKGEPFGIPLIDLRFKFQVSRFRIQDSGFKWSGIPET